MALACACRCAGELRLGAPDSVVAEQDVAVFAQSRSAKARATLVGFELRPRAVSYAKQKSKVAKLCPQGVKDARGM